MIARVLISSDLSRRTSEISKILEDNKLLRNNPDLLYIEDDEKLGVEASKRIREFLSIKPFQEKGRAVVLESAGKLTLEAQNSLLKTLEEPPEEALILLGANREAELLPTIISRCQIITLSNTSIPKNPKISTEQLLNLTLEEKFEFIEKLEEKEAFLNELANYFRNNLSNNPQYSQILEEILEGYKYKENKGNLRAILEYLMLCMPTK